MCPQCRQSGLMICPQSSGHTIWYQSSACASAVSRTSCRRWIQYLSARLRSIRNLMNRRCTSLRGLAPVHAASQPRGSADAAQQLSTLLPTSGFMPLSAHIRVSVYPADPVCAHLGSSLGLCSAPTGLRQVPPHAFPVQLGGCAAAEDQHSLEPVLLGSQTARKRTARAMQAGPLTIQQPGILRLSGWEGCKPHRQALQLLMRRQDASFPYSSEVISACMHGARSRTTARVCAKQAVAGTGKLCEAYVC